jgi:predicted PurR-regulated permease PerM
MEALAMTLELPGQEPIPVAMDPPRRSPAAELGLARTVIEATVRVGLFLVLVAWCFWIARPFLVAVLWGLILAIAVHPGFCRLCDLMAGRRRTVAGLMTLLALLMLIGPLSLLTLALIDNIGELAARLTAGAISVPPPPPRLAALPLVGEAAERLWSLASVNFLAALEEVRPQLASLGRWLLRLVAGVSLGALNFMLAVVVAGLLLAHDEQGGRLAHAVARKLAGARGPMLALLAEQTVRNVARGVLGTALIQSTLAGLGLVLADVPGAAILTLVCFLLCIVQIGPAILLIAAVAYLFSTAPMTVAVLFTVWSVFVALVDNLLRPILIGRGSEVPLAVILIPSP